VKFETSRINTPTEFYQLVNRGEPFWYLHPHAGVQGPCVVERTEGYGVDSAVFLLNTGGFGSRSFEYLADLLENGAFIEEDEATRFAERLSEELAS